MTPLEGHLLWLLLAALAGLCGGYGGRRWATWAARRDVELSLSQIAHVAAQLDVVRTTLTAEIESRITALDLRLEALVRRVASAEGRKGVERKKSRQDEDDQIRRTLELELTKKRNGEPALDSETAEMLARLKAEDAGDAAS